MKEEPKDIKIIFSEALEKKTPQERAAYLERACGDDTNLRAKVEDLLKAHEEAGSFLDAPPFDPNVTLITSPLTEGPGTIIGRYKLLEQIGEGGFGVVYMAEQQEPIRRRVALKIIKLGMDTKQVIARFEAERQALAMMDHPNIARVFDAGATDTGRPYFVMELVKGIPITEYCDKNNLDTRQRLELFIDVCKAVQHAHQKGIIHRDIKPSNVMITLHDGKPVPKVIDFGIAKATGHRLTEKTLFTKYAQMIGTPEYMSPEQAEMSGLDIDTRTDIYSLGVLLYELLTSATPFDAKELREAGYIQMQQIIRETEPLRPSTKLNTMGDALTDIAKHRQSSPALLPKLVSGDLDWIAMKTLEKDRTRRYETANELAMDIQRHLSNEPVEASPPSTLYRFKKLVQKHRRTVAAVITIAATLIIGLLVSTTMYLVANRARRSEAVARTQAEQAKVIAEQAEKVAQEQKNIAETKAEDLRRAMYVNSIQLADFKYNERNISRVRELLNACPNDLRGWEWNRLSHVMDQSSMTLRGHNSPICSVAISPDGRRIVSSARDATIRIWDTGTGAQLLKLQGQGEYIFSCVTYSPDGTHIASGGHDGKVRIWDALTGEELKVLSGHKGVIQSVIFSPEGKQIVSGGYDGIIKVWDSETGLEVKTSREHGSYLLSLAFSPDGRKIISAGGDRQVKVWDAATGSEAMILKGAVEASFSPDGKYIAGADDYTVKLWDALTGEQLASFGAHSGMIRALAFTGDGRYVVFGGWTCAIRIWDIATKSEVRILGGHESPVELIVSARDGNRLVSGSRDGTIKIWDLTCDRERVTLRSPSRPGHVLAGVSPDGQRVVSYAFDSDSIRIFDVISGMEVATLRKPGARIDSSCISVDGRRIVSGNSDGTVNVWDTQTGANIRTLRGHEDAVMAVAFTPDGKHIISGSMDKTIKTWDAESGTELMTLRGHPDGVRSMACSPDGKHIVSGGRDGILKVWDIAVGAEVATLHGHSDGVISVSFSPDGQRIVSASFDGVLKVWDVATCAEVQTLRGHNGLVQSAAYSPDGKRIVSGGADYTVRVWDAITGAELLTIGGYESPIWSTVFTPDGKTLAVAGPGVTLLESAIPRGGYGPRKTNETARKVVDELHQKYGYYYEVIDKLQVDKTLDEPIRKVTLQIANSRMCEDAEKLVDELYKKHGSYYEVIEKLQADKALDEPTRKLALQIATSRKPEDVEKLMKEIGEEFPMEMVSSPGGDPNAYRAALEKVQKASLMDPNNVGVLVALGMIQHFAGQYEDVIKTLTRAHRLEPNTPAILGPLSEAQYRARKYEDALKTLTEELEIDRRVLGEQDPLTLYSMNQLACMQAGCPVAEVRNGAEAVKNATRACELTQWKEAQYIDTLAAAYSETGDFDSAVKWQKKAISLLTKEDPAEWPAEFEERLKLYELGKPYRESPYQ